MSQNHNNRQCATCGAKPGDLHNPGCDVEQCANCGYQLISCVCGNTIGGLIPWTGAFPGAKECREYGLWCRWGTGWLPCDGSHPDAIEDINRLYEVAEWDAKARRYVLKSNPVLADNDAARMTPLTYADIWEAYVAGAKDGQRYPGVHAHFIHRSADAYCKLVHLNKDPEHFHAMGKSTSYQMKHLHEHQQRVVDEKNELDEKLAKLSSFIQSSPVFQGLPVDEQERLRRQLTHMQAYSGVLGERIAAF